MEMQDCAALRAIPELAEPEPVRTCPDFVERSISVMPDDAYSPLPSVASVYSFQLYSELEQCNLKMLEAIQALCCSETMDNCTFVEKEMATEFLQRWQNVQRMALSEQVQRILGKF